ncbi:MAG TPA: 2-oxoglutarate dehydrogenase complex dihydrolipoyllysine-residue succinyltransferase [Chthoniobacterales bacterium]|nr:2-oxoglutarate dehydrogenase complex dihydrolipoyllysine-residue succinyltransferase [Chthoniobacterales bacterium]
MSIEVKVPAVGESISSGVVSVWHKKSGEEVKAGDPLFTLETDKVSTEINAEKDGVLQTMVAEGAEVKIGDVVATIEEGSASDTKPAAEPKAAKAETKSAPADAKPDGQKPVPPAEPSSDALSPAARRIVTEEKLDPQEIRGSGKGGRVTKGDALTAAQNRSAPPESAPAAAPTKAAENRAEEKPAQSEDERFSRKKMSPLRRKIAAQLVMAQHTAAILTTFNECDMTEVQTLRTKLQDAFTKKNGLKLGFMSFFIKAVVEALKAVPSINSRIEGDDLILNHYFDIGVAVGTERGLVVPVVRDADKKGFAQIERDIADYATKAREGKIKIEDLQGGTFTISNGGVYGSMMGTPILNPPQSGILGMHAIIKRPVAVKDEVVIRPMMYLALSYDHRAVDGKEAVTFLVTVKQCIEDPKKLPIDF